MDIQTINEFKDLFKKIKPTIKLENNSLSIKDKKETYKLNLSPKTIQGYGFTR